jgi:hypothetical protein
MSSPNPTVKGLIVLQIFTNVIALILIIIIGMLTGAIPELSLIVGNRGDLLFDVSLVNTQIGYATIAVSVIAFIISMILLGIVKGWRGLPYWGWSKGGLITSLIVFLTVVIASIVGKTTFLQSPPTPAPSSVPTQNS